MKQKPRHVVGSLVTKRLAWSPVPEEDHDENLLMLASLVPDLIDLLPPATRPSFIVDLKTGFDLDAAVVQFKRTVIDAYLEATSHNVLRTSKLLNIPRTTLMSRIKELQRDAPLDRRGVDGVQCPDEDARGEAV